MTIAAKQAERSFIALIWFFVHAKGFVFFCSLTTTKFDQYHAFVAIFFTLMHHLLLIIFTEYFFHRHRQPLKGYYLGALFSWLYHYLSFTFTYINFLKVSG